MVALKFTLHDVVTIENETKGDGERKDSKLPEWDWGLGLSSLSSVPGTVDDSPWTDRVTDIVSTVSE
jgi:hypothetical protein